MFTKTMEPGHEPGILFEGRGEKDRRGAERKFSSHVKYPRREGQYIAWNSKEELKKYLKFKVNNSLSRTEPRIAFDFWSSVHNTEYFVKINHW